jgi:hypothetical protein
MTVTQAKVWRNSERGESVSALPSFHTKALADKQADKQTAIDERKRADEFLSTLDELLSDAS